MPKKKISGVVKSLYNHTAVIVSSYIVRHKKYRKNIIKMNKFHAHVNNPDLLKIGQTVEIEETAPISKTKTWIILEG